MSQHPSNDPLHGVTLETILNRLVEKYGWQELGQKIRIKCFNQNPGIKSSLKFLRKTAWARDKVEQLYINTDWQENSVWIRAANNRRKLVK